MLKDFMTSWLESVVALNVKPSSMQVCQSIFKSQIAPYLGEVKVQELTPAMLDKWLRILQRQGLAFNTLSTLYAFMHHALSYMICLAQLISSDEHIQRQSNSLHAPGGEKVVCTRDDGRIILRGVLVDLLREEGLNAHSFRHTHATR